MKTGRGLKANSVLLPDSVIHKGTCTVLKHVFLHLEGQ